MQPIFQKQQKQKKTFDFGLRWLEVVKPADLRFEGVSPPPHTEEKIFDLLCFLFFF